MKREPDGCLESHFRERASQVWLRVQECGKPARELLPPVDERTDGVQALDKCDFGDWLSIGALDQGIALSSLISEPLSESCRPMLESVGWNLHSLLVDRCARGSNPHLEGTLHRFEEAEGCGETTQVVVEGQVSGDHLLVLPGCNR